MQADATELHYAIKRLLREICEGYTSEPDAITAQIIREFAGVVLNGANAERMIERIYELCEREHQRDLELARTLWEQVREQR